MKRFQIQVHWRSDSFTSMWPDPEPIPGHKLLISAGKWVRAEDVDSIQQLIRDTLEGYYPDRPPADLGVFIDELMELLGVTEETL